MYKTFLQGYLEEKNQKSICSQNVHKLHLIDKKKLFFQIFNPESDYHAIPGLSLPIIENVEK